MVDCWFFRRPHPPPGRNKLSVLAGLARLLTLQPAGRENLFQLQPAAYLGPGAALQNTH